MEDKKKYLITSILLVIFTYISYINFDFNFIARFLTNSFAFGRGNTKPLLFFLYASLCFFLLSFNWKKKLRLNPKILCILFILILITPLLTHLIFSVKYNVGIFDKTVLIKEKEISSNQLFQMDKIKIRKWKTNSKNGADSSPF